MRVLVVDPSNYTPYYDYHLCRALREAGCSVELATSRFVYEHLPFGSDPLFRYHFFRRLPPPRAGRIRQAAKAVQYPVDLVRLVRHVFRSRTDVVHFQWLLAPRLELATFRLIRRAGCRVVCTIHNVRRHEDDGLPVALYRRLARHTDALIVHAELDRRDLAAVMDTAPKVRVIPHGALFTDYPRIDRVEARRQLGLPESGPIILFFGLIERYKGLDDLLRAFAHVAKALPDAWLVVAGKANFKFDANVLAGGSYGGKVLIRPGFVPSERVSAYFSAADVVALPYLRASQSGVLLTAYHFGVPVVATRTGALEEMVDSDGTGRLVEPGNADEMAQSLILLLSDPEALRRHGIAGQQCGEEKYNWRAIARETIAAYQSG